MRILLLIFNSFLLFIYTLKVLASLACLAQIFSFTFTHPYNYEGTLILRILTYWYQYQQTLAAARTRNTSVVMFSDNCQIISDGQSTENCMLWHWPGNLMITTAAAARCKIFDGRRFIITAFCCCHATMHTTPQCTGLTLSEMLIMIVSLIDQTINCLTSSYLASLAAVNSVVESWSLVSAHSTQNMIIVVELCNKKRISQETIYINWLKF